MSFFESQVSEDTTAKFGSQAADKASRYEKDSMLTKRETGFNFMVLKLTDVIQDLTRNGFLSQLLATALNQKDTLERLPRGNGSSVLRWPIPQTSTAVVEGVYHSTHSRA